MLINMHYISTMLCAKIGQEREAMYMLNDTIAAVSTADVEAAISIVRMSGQQAIEIANEIFTRDLTTVPSHTVHYGLIKNGQETIDEVLVSVFREPKTFTREDIVEINCHGGRIVTRRVLSLCLEHGARLARPGEFTQRAFLNGRIDLTQAEAIGDLIHADSQRSAKMAIGGVKGSVKSLIQPVIDELLELIATIEVNIDYPEYDDVEQLTDEVVLPRAERMMQKMKDIERKAESGRILKEGVKTVIAGKPNVGKSSLLNALLEEEKAIVTDIAGTTRDLVEGIIPLENVTLHLLDTAGLRETEDVVEKIGIQKTLKALEDAELVIVVLDGSRAIDEEDQMLLERTKEMNRIIVTNKSDLSTQFKEGIVISAAQNDISGLIDEINARYEKHQFALEEGTLNNERQIGLIRKAIKAMNQAIAALRQGAELDLVTIDFQECYIALKEILGEVSREDLLDAIFSNFCLGK